MTSAERHPDLPDAIGMAIIEALRARWPHWNDGEIGTPHEVINVIVATLIEQGWGPRDAE